STYTMLVRAYKLRHFVDEFVLKMFWAEKNNAAKAKLEQLRLSPEECKHAKLFTVLLSFADNAQQEFSSDQYPSLTLALPALEGLHHVWSECYDDEKYTAFRPALAATINTIKSYYDLTSENSAYMISMVLDPGEKMQHFAKNWSDDEQRSVSERTKDISATMPDPIATPVATPAWEREFNKYISGDLEDIPAEMSLVTWWGVNAPRYPVWASLARDYLAIMASSVSSEHAFSSAGITITKRRNRLKADVVEALQGLKCALKRNLLVRVSGPSSVIEEQLEVKQEAESALEDSATAMALESDDNTVVLVLDLDSDAEEEDEISH
ncbi:hypothetical protein EWM64_g10969, partial [Hericium alpestre]